MLVDFHSHLVSENSIVCTDTPKMQLSGTALLKSIGLLPDKWTKDLEDTLVRSISENVDLHLGEVGLDRRFEHIVPMDMQAQILSREIRMASSLGRCISLHCVRETGKMLSILQELTFRPFSVLWHGFTGSPETAALLHKKGVIVSIGAGFHGDVRKLFEANPMLALETDYTGSEASAHTDILESLYLAVSKALDIPLPELEDHCIKVFGLFSGKSV